MTTWTQVYYTNTLAIPALVCILVSTGEVGTLMDFNFTFTSWLWLLMSAGMGVAIAYFSFMARTAVSATYFTVIGNACKVLTVFINVMMWDFHASPAGLFSLGICLLGAYFYKQAPMRSEKSDQNI